MADTYITYQQHEPLRVPSGWGTQEKRFISQLEEILDDIYRRFNRIKLSDLGAPLQEMVKTASTDVAEIKTELRLLEDSIALLATKQELNAVEGRVTTAESSITAMAGDIALKADQTTVNSLSSLVDTKNRTYAQAAAPSGTDLKVGDLWIDTDDNNKLYRWSGSSWDAYYDTHLDATVSQAVIDISGNTAAIALKVDTSTYTAGMNGKLGKNESAIGVTTTGSEVVINTSGITMSGGSINMDATSDLGMHSGGRIDINGATGSIDLGTNSQLSAAMGHFDVLFVDGRQYLPVIFSRSRPQAWNVYWAKPVTNPEFGNAYMKTPSTRTLSLGGFDLEYGIQSNKHIYTISAGSDDVVNAVSGLTYTIKVPFYRVNSGNATKDFRCRVYRGSEYVGFSGSVTVPPGQVTWMTFTSSSTYSDINLFTSALVGTGFTVQMWCANPNASTVYLQSSNTVTITCTYSGAITGPTECTLYYIPESGDG